jgi:hypothetical protein
MGYSLYSISLFFAEGLLAPGADYLNYAMFLGDMGIKNLFRHLPVSVDKFFGPGEGLVC